jgi:hypothetical protein
MEFVIIALLVAKWCEKGAIDIVSMITGNQPPSKTYQDAKGTTKDDGPLGKFLKAWWADAIEDLDEKRRLARIESKEEQDKERARRKAERQRILDAIEEKAAADKAEREERKRADDIPVEESPDPADSDAGDPPVEECPEELPPVEDDRQEEWRREQEEAADAEQKRQEEWRERAGDRRPWDEVPPIEEKADGSVDPEESKEQGSKDDTKIFDADIVEPTPEIEAGSPGPSGPTIPELTVIPGQVEQGGQSTGGEEWSAYGSRPQLYAVPNQEPTGAAGGTKGTDMSGEVAVEGGITQHINWTAAVADYQVRAAGHVEMVGAMMFQGDNGPERLALVAAIREQHRQLRELYMRLNQVLVNDKNLVGDAYAATGGQAGGKPYVTS